MSPWPAVVIQGVFVEQANSVCYLLCTIFISENCIVSPFGEKVMEWGGKQRVCHSPGFWWCCTTRLRGSHILPVILTLNQTCQHTERVHFLNQNEKELRAIQATVYLGAFWTCEMAVNVCDLTFLPYPWTSILWPSWSGEHILHTHMCCGVGRGGCSLLKSPNFHCHGSFGSCTVELTCMAILWRAEPRWGQPRGLYVSNLWEQHAPNDVAEESMLKTHGLFRRFKWTGHCAT